MNFTSLHSDILKYISTYLELPDLYHLRLVSRSCYRELYDETFWQVYLKTRYPEYIKSCNISWLKVSIEFCQTGAKLITAIIYGFIEIVRLLLSNPLQAI